MTRILFSLCARAVLFQNKQSQQYPWTCKESNTNCLGYISNPATNRYSNGMNTTVSLKANFLASL